jgi:hypothetical protein
MLEIIKKALGDKFKTIPVLNLDGKYGYTGYIDFITADVMVAPIMKGYDSLGRRFISIKTNTEVVGEDEEEMGVEQLDSMKKGYKKQMVGTFFERYPNDNKTWAYGTCYMQGILYTDSRVRLDDLENLEKRLTLLFNKQKILNIDSWRENDDRVNGNGLIEIELA